MLVCSRAPQSVFVVGSCSLTDHGTSCSGRTRRRRCGRRGCCWFTCSAQFLRLRCKFVCQRLQRAFVCATRTWICLQNARRASRASLFAHFPVFRPVESIVCARCHWSQHHASFENVAVVCDAGALMLLSRRNELQNIPLGGMRRSWREYVHTAPLPSPPPGRGLLLYSPGTRHNIYE